MLSQEFQLELEHAVEIDDLVRSVARVYFVVHKLPLGNEGNLYQR